MPFDRLGSDRLRRTEAVIEILRRRAELRRAHGEAVPPALSQALAEFDRKPTTGHATRDRVSRSASR